MGLTCHYAASSQARRGPSLCCSLYWGVVEAAAIDAACSGRTRVQGGRTRTAASTVAALVASSASTAASASEEKQAQGFGMRTVHGEHLVCCSLLYCTIYSAWFWWHSRIDVFTRRKSLFYNVVVNMPDGGASAHRPQPRTAEVVGVMLLGPARWRDLGVLVAAASLLLQSVCGAPPATGTFSLCWAL